MTYCAKTVTTAVTAYVTYVTGSVVLPLTCCRKHTTGLLASLCIKRCFGAVAPAVASQTASSSSSPAVSNTTQTFSNATVVPAVTSVALLGGYPTVAFQHHRTCQGKNPHSMLADAPQSVICRVKGYIAVQHWPEHHFTRTKRIVYKVHMTGSMTLAGSSHCT